MSRRATRMLLLALSVLLAGLAAACSTAQPETTLDRVKDSGVLRVGTEGTYSPFSFHDPTTNELTGYDVEIITAVADRMGVKAEFVEAPWDAIFASLLSDRFDVVANQVTKNAEREAKIRPVGAVHVLRRGDRHPRRRHLDPLTRRSEGQDHGPELDQQLGQGGHGRGGEGRGGRRVHPGGDAGEAAAGGRHRERQPGGAGVRQDDQDKDVKIAAETGDTSEQVFALRPEDGALRDAINQSLNQLRTDGTLAEISSNVLRHRRLDR